MLKHFNTLSPYHDINNNNITATGSKSLETKLRGASTQNVWSKL